MTGLVEQGYDDASVDAIPLIVEYGAATRSVPAAPRFSDSTAKRPSINGSAVAADKQTAERFWETITPETDKPRFTGGIARVSLDSKVELSLSDTVAQVGAPEVWAEGLDGTGVTVAVLDTGVDVEHPDLADRVAQTESFVPGQTGEQIKQALASTARPLDGETAYEVGGGRLDLPSSVHGTVIATASASFGQFAWPHGGDAPVERSVTYTNLDDEPVTLSLSESTTDADDQTAPEGVFTFSTDEITVPAHGTADVTVTAHPDEGAAGKQYSGTVIASAGGEQVAQTAVGLVKDEERYNLDLDTVDRQGGPGSGYVTLYRYGDQFVTTLEIDLATGEVPTQRLLPGTYNVTSWPPVKGPKGSDGVALVGTPAVTLDAGRRVVLDARDANPITTKVQKKTETTYRRPTAAIRASTRAARNSRSSPSPRPRDSRCWTGSPPAKAVSVDVHGTGFPAYLYDLTPSYSGGIPADLSYAPAQQDLATVKNRFVGNGSGLAIESRADCRSWYWPPCLQVYEPVLPGSTRTDYVDAHQGNDWYEQVDHTSG